MRSVVFDIGPSAVVLSSSKELKDGIHVGFAPDAEAWMTQSHGAFVSISEVLWLADKLMDLAEHEAALERSQSSEVKQ